jgi:hypothetical protein
VATDLSDLGDVARLAADVGEVYVPGTVVATDGGRTAV